MKSLKNILAFSIILILAQCDDNVPELEKIKEVDFTLVVPETSTQADGETLANLVVNIESETSFFKEVIFETQKGVFTNGKTADTVNIESSQAKAYLSSAEEGNTIVSAKIGSKSISKTVSFSKSTISYDITINKNNQPADGNSQAEILVTFEKDNMLKMPEKVIIETQRGLLSNGKTIDTVQFEVDSTARTYITSEVAETFLITTKISDLSKSSPITFIKPFSGLEITTEGVTSVLANNNFFIPITIRVLNPAENVAIGSIEISSSLGVFTNNNASINLTPNPGETSVTTELRSNTSGKATISASIDNFSANYQVDFLEEGPLFDLEVIHNNVPSDGVSQAAVKLTYSRLSIPSASANTVTFSLNKGQFAGGGLSTTITLNNDSTAIAYLTNTTNTQVVVSAMLEGKTIQTPVEFSRAYPETIVLNADKPSITNSLDQIIQLDAKLFREYGMVNSGFIPIWEDSTTSGVSPGIFLNITPSGNNGIASSEYHLLDSTFSGIIYLKAMISSDTSNVSGKTKILVHD